MLNARNLIHLLLAVPALLAAWLLVAYALYVGLAGALNMWPVDESPSLVAFWALAFAFGLTAMSTLVAARVEFVSSALVRAACRFSLFTTAVLFGGYLALGAFAGVAFLALR